MGVSPFFGVCFIADKTLGYTRFAFYTRIPTPPFALFWPEKYCFPFIRLHYRFNERSRAEVLSPGTSSEQERAISGESFFLSYPQINPGRRLL
jgi:hypothetical protein